MRTDVHFYIKYETEILQNMHDISVSETHFAHFAGLSLILIISHLNNAANLDNMGCETL